MKTSKKILSIILAVMMIVSIVPITANAASPCLAIMVNNTEPKIGDIVIVSVTISKDSSLACFTADLVYDASAFKLTNMTASSDAVSGAVVIGNFAAGKARYTVATSSTIEKAGILFTVELETLKLIDSEIKIDVEEAVDNEYNEVPVCSNKVYFKSPCVDGHDYSAFTVTKEPACKESGIRQVHCKICGDTIKETIPATGKCEPSVWNYYKEASCETDGEKQQKCIYCGDVLTTETIPAYGHSYENRAITPAPSYVCTADVHSWDECNNCGDVINEIIIPAPGHNYTWYTISIATCETDGVKLGECSVCGDIDLDATLKLGHDFANGICNNCGVSESGNDGGNTGEDVTEPDTPDEPENIEYNFNIKTPSTTSINHKDGIILYAEINGNAPNGSYIEWTYSNSNFKTTVQDNGNSLKIVSDSNGKTTFTATLYSADGEVLATHSIEMNSKAGFFDKIGSFFRSLFGGTKIYDN